MRGESMSNMKGLSENDKKMMDLHRRVDSFKEEKAAEEKTKKGQKGESEEEKWQKNPHSLENIITPKQIGATEEDEKLELDI